MIFLFHAHGNQKFRAERVCVRQISIIRYTLDYFVNYHKSPTFAPQI